MKKFKINILRFVRKEKKCFLSLGWGILKQKGKKGSKNICFRIFFLKKESPIWKIPKETPERVPRIPNEESGFFSFLVFVVPPPGKPGKTPLFLLKLICQGPEALKVPPSFKLNFLVTKPFVFFATKKVFWWVGWGGFFLLFSPVFLFPAETMFFSKKMPPPKKKTSPSPPCIKFFIEWTKSECCWSRSAAFAVPPSVGLKMMKARGEKTKRLLIKNAFGFLKMDPGVFGNRGKVPPIKNGLIFCGALQTVFPPPWKKNLFSLDPQPPICFFFCPVPPGRFLIENKVKVLFLNRLPPRKIGGGRVKNAKNC